jgi:hypothetical protein
MNTVNTAQWGHVEVKSKDFTSAELAAAIRNNHPHAAQNMPADSLVSVFLGERGIKKALVSIPSHEEGILIQNRTAKASLDSLFEKIARIFIDEVPRLLLSNHRAK